MNPRLAIDYGAVATRAVVAWPDGRSMVLSFDGGSVLSSAAHVGSAGITIGADAWRAAAVDPDGLVLSPLHEGVGQLTVNGHVVQVGELVAATLRHIAGEADRVVGQPVNDVRLVVPAGWGPRRRTWLRHAARQAGLPVTRLVEAPVAAAGLLPTGGSPDPILVVDLGGGAEATVLQPGPAGFEVLSTVADLHAGGDRIDEALVASLCGVAPADLPSAQRWTVLADARTTKHALAEQVAVTMRMPGNHPALAINTSQVSQIARPVLERVGDLAAAAVRNADLTAGQLASVHLIGGASRTLGAAEIITAKLGVTALPAPQPALTAARGAADTGPTTMDASKTASRLQLPPWRRLANLGLPGLFSLLLYAHFVFSADFNNGTPDSPKPGYYVLAAWGELATASGLATIAALQAGYLLAVLLGQQSPPAATDNDQAGRVATGLSLATGSGLAVAGLYALTAATYFGYPVTLLLRWSLLPTVSTSACGAILAGLAWRGHRPTAGWDRFLAFPLSATIAAAAGVAAVTVWWQGGLPWWANGWLEPAGYLGGALIGVGTVCALIRHSAARFILGGLLGIFTMIISRGGPGSLAVIYSVAVTAWWARRVWTLIRARPTSDHAGPAPSWRSR